MPLSKKQLEILDHTANRAAQGLYCGGGSDMDELVRLEMMQFAGKKSFVPDPYYRITEKGLQELRESKSK